METENFGEILADEEEVARRAEAEDEYIGMVYQNEGGYNGEACAWCGNTVKAEGDVCDLQCYTTWYAWMTGSEASDLLSVTDDGRVLILANDGGYANTLESQPWYGGLVGAA